MSVWFKVLWNYGVLAKMFPHERGEFLKFNNPNSITVCEFSSLSGNAARRNNDTFDCAMIYHCATKLLKHWSAYCACESFTL